MEDAAGNITAAENALRSLVFSQLHEKYGAKWLENSGVTADRIKIWRDRQEEETKRRKGTRSASAILDYSDLTDLHKIVTKHWELFHRALGEKKTLDVYMERLITYRTALMHGRELAPFEVSLAAGMSGEIRNKVTVFRSEAGPHREYFPRIEYVRDSFGNRVTEGKSASTGLVLHPGDTVIFECKGWDPEGTELSWSVFQEPENFKVDGDRITWHVKESDIQEAQHVFIRLHSSRSYHRTPTGDGEVCFVYKVLPLSR